MADEGCPGWSAINPVCRLGQGAEAVAGNAIQNMANAVIEAYGKAVATLGTLWVNVGTPNLSEGNGTSPVLPGEYAPDSYNISVILGWVTWGAFALAILSLFILGGLLATRMRAGEGVAAVGRIGIVLVGVVVISAATSLAAALLPDGPRGVSGAVGFLQSSLWWYMGAAVMASVLIGGVRMVWEQRAQPGKDLAQSLLVMIGWAGAGIAAVSLLLEAADSWSVSIINASLTCDVETGTCFQERMGQMIALTMATTGGLGPLLIIVLGVIAVLASIFQILLMVARGGMLVILTGILPLAFSATNTEMGKSWAKRCVGWLIAVILYKPAAAIVYATAFQLTGTDVNIFNDDGSGLIQVLTGLMLMMLALFALPALMKFVTPMVGAVAGGSGGALAAGAMASLPSGAASIGRLASGAGKGSAGAAGPSGGPGPGGSTSSRPTGSSTSGQPAAAASRSAGAQDAGAASAGPSPRGTGAGAPTAGGTAGGAGAASGAGGAAAGGAAAGGGAAAAGAAGGPVGVAAGAALDMAKKGGQAAAGAVQSIGEQSTGEGDGPSGSNG